MPEAIKPALAAFALTFLFTLHATPATYVNSNFLAQFFTAQEIGWLFAFGAAAGLLGLWVANRGVRRWGNYRVLRVVLWGNLAAVLVLAWAPGALASAAAFCFGFAMGVVANFLIDIFVEAVSRDADTGALRGWYLTALNLAWLAGPLAASLLLTDHNFHRVYLWGAVFLLFTLIFLSRRFAKFDDPCYEPADALGGFRQIWAQPDLRRAFVSFLVLQGFYAWMIIYVPLHLTQVLGFSVGDVAGLAAIALLPFLILQEWLGKLADCCTGEKEFLTGGLAVLGLSTLGLAFVTSGSFLVWAVALFVNRVGAAMVESMSYSYIFRRVSAAQANVMEAFHGVRPTATIIAPMIAAPVFVWGGGVPALFAVLGLVCLATIVYVRPLRDSR